jgi:hypothetical protein
MWPNLEAMITRIKLEESIEAFGGIGGGTMTKHVVAALLKLGINCGDPLHVTIKANDHNKTISFSYLPKIVLNRVSFRLCTLWK